MSSADSALQVGYLLLKCSVLELRLAELCTQIARGARLRFCLAELGSEMNVCERKSVDLRLVTAGKIPCERARDTSHDE